MEGQVNKQVAAGDQVEFRERRILDDMIGGVHVHLADFFDHAVIVAVFGEPALQSPGRCLDALFCWVVVTKKGEESVLTRKRSISLPRGSDEASTLGLKRECRPKAAIPEGRSRVRLPPVAAIPVATVLIFSLVLIRLVAADETAGARAKQGVVPDKVASRSADCCPLQTTRGLCRSQPSGQGEGESSRNQN